MSIRYIVTPKKDPRNPDATPKFYMMTKSFAAVDRDFLIKDMVNHTSLTAQEAATGIDYLFEVIPKYIFLGFTVQIGKLGYFTVAIKSEGSDTEKEATADKIKRKRLVFVVGKDIRKKINEFPAERYDKKDL